MKKPNCAKKIIIVFILLSVVFCKKTYAYIDPGSGSYVFQMLIGFLIGGLFAVKIFWQKITVFLRGLFFKERKDGNPKEKR